MTIYANGVDIEGGGSSSSGGQITLATSGSADGSEGAAWQTVGSRRLDPADYSAVTWRFTAEGVSSGTTGEVRLYDATNDVAVVSLTMTATDPADPNAVQSDTFDAPAVETQYLVQIRVPATGSQSDSFTLTAAYLAV